ncbi:hypothetical protein IQ238_13415 [Pleurocapsales cyanobacterium LEGE 06147]|nr:hypothetical protein [Pleurocapsales cyanobacterium LEGE 06147]
MTHLPQDEERNLVNFLRQNYPVPPPAKSDEEEQLMELLQQQPYRSQQQKRKPLWMISSAIVAGILLLWGSDRWLQYKTQLVIDADALATFLVTTWNDALLETTFSDVDEEATYSLLSALQKSQVASSSP